MTNSLLPAVQASNCWRDLYMLALFETDRAQIAVRISQAENAIVGRTRELFIAGNDVAKEQQALDTSLQALRALRSCLDLNDTKITNAA